MPKLAVLVSGTGSNLEAILKYPLPVELVVADRECPALEIAINARLPNVIIDRTFNNSFERDKFTGHVLDALKKYKIDMVAMAGFMTILSPFIFTYYPELILNIHPSLLPNFKGAHAVRDTLASGAKVTGCTVHIATAQLDEGPILAQQKVPVLNGDTVTTLHERIKVAERELYPRTIAKFLGELS